MGRPNLNILAALLALAATVSADAPPPPTFDAAGEPRWPEPAEPAQEPGPAAQRSYDHEAAARLREERVRRKHENWLKRQPKP